MPRGTAPLGPAGPVASPAERELLTQALALALPQARQASAWQICSTWRPAGALRKWW